MERLDLFRNPSSYACFIAAMHRAYSTLEPLLEQRGAARLLPDWPKRKRLADLRRDCTALNVTPAPAAGSFNLPPGDAGMLGALYVTEGSSLGARLLAIRVRAIGLDEATGGAFLARQSREIGLWRDYVDALERAALSAEDEADMREAAMSTFELVHDCLMKSTCYEYA